MDRWGNGWDIAVILPESVYLPSLHECGPLIAAGRIFFLETEERFINSRFSLQSYISSQLHRPIHIPTVSAGWST
jgi:hypothetical protein